MRPTELLLCIVLMCCICLMTPYHSIQGLGLFILYICVGLCIIAIPSDYKSWKNEKKIRKYT